MKRMACILLILAFLMSFYSVRVSANENDDYSHSSITFVVDKDGGAYELSLPIIVKGREFYVEPQNLADITRYQFSSDGDRLIYTLGLKSLLIDVSKQTLEVNLSEQAFSGSFFIDGIHYLPMSEMLPWMNVQCYVSNDKLHIDSDIKSYWEVIESFNPQDYLFDLAETYGETAGDVIGLCAISVFDCILDLGNIWKKVVPVDNGGTSLYEYEIYKECFREFALPEVGTEAEVQKLLSEMSDVVSDSSQFLNAYYTPIFTQETHDKIEALFGEDIAEGFEEWPTDATQITDSLKLAKDALKYMKTGVLYTRIAMADTTDYAEALRFIYMREGAMPPGGVELAASEAIIALESQAGAVADAVATVLSDIGMSILEDASEEVVEDAVQAAAGDTIFGSLGLYLDIVDATLSLVWPVNDAYAEITKMTVYQEIQYDALNAYYSVEKYNSEVSVQDISNARTSALIFLKTARKCFLAQQDTFDLYGGDGVLDSQINLIKDKIQEFQLASLSEENDAICDKSALVAELKNLFRVIDPVEQSAKPQYDAREILSAWYLSQYTQSDLEKALLVDVTHDGQVELIVVTKDTDSWFTGDYDFAFTGEVYTVDAYGSVQQIELLRFDSPVFGWYLKKTEQGYNLIEETQGVQIDYYDADFAEYYLDSQGNRIVVIDASVSSADDKDWEQYQEKRAYIEGNVSVICFSAKFVVDTTLPLDENMILKDWITSDKTIDCSELLGNWYYYEETETGGPPLISYLYFYEDGTAHLGVGYYSTDAGSGFNGNWTPVATTEDGYVVRLEGTAGYYSLGTENEDQAFSADVHISVSGKLMLIEGMDVETTFWSDGKWHERDLDYSTWADGSSSNANLVYATDSYLYYCVETDSGYSNLVCLDLFSGKTVLVDENVLDNQIQIDNGYMYYTKSLEMYAQSFRRVKVGTMPLPEDVEAVNSGVVIDGSEIIHSSAHVSNGEFYNYSWFNSNACCSIYKYSSSENATIICDRIFPPANLSVYNGRLYFDGVNLSEDGIYTVSTDGGQHEELYRGSARILCIDDEYIYFSTGKNSEGIIDICNIPIQGGEAVQLVAGHAEYVAAYDGWVYFIDTDDLNKIKRVNSATCKKQTLANTECSDFVIDQKNRILYYLCDNSVSQVFSIDIEED